MAAGHGAFLHLPELFAKQLRTAEKLMEKNHLQTLRIVRDLFTEIPIQIEAEQLLQEFENAEEDQEAQEAVEEVASCAALSIVLGVLPEKEARAEVAEEVGQQWMKEVNWLQRQAREAEEALLKVKAERSAEAAAQAEESVRRATLAEETLKRARHDWADESAAQASKLRLDTQQAEESLEKALQQWAEEVAQCTGELRARTVALDEARAELQVLKMDAKVHRLHAELQAELVTTQAKTGWLSPEIEVIEEVSPRLCVPIDSTEFLPVCLGRDIFASFSGCRVASGSPTIPEGSTPLSSDHLGLSSMSTAFADDKQSLRQRVSKAAFQASNLGCRASSERSSIALFTDVRNSCTSFDSTSDAVQGHYKKSGFCQWIARSSIFENITLGIIAVNAIWLAVDMDFNQESSIVGAHPVFAIADNAFCAYFVSEFLVRCGAMANVVQSCWDQPSLTFDGALMIITVIETWMMPLIFVMTSQSSEDFAFFKVLRLLRLTRVMRMYRVLQMMPELMVFVRGMAGAARAVLCTLVLLILVIYFFALILTQITDGFEPLHSNYFSNVQASMNTLLLQGTLGEMDKLVDVMGQTHFVFACIMLIFILMSSLTVMNMLIGVLVDVVSIVAATEHEQMRVRSVKSEILQMLETTNADEDGSTTISREEFENLLLLPEAARVLQDVGVDVVGLVDFTDFIFKDNQELTVHEFMDLVLQLRGSKGATVRDMVDLRKYVHDQMHDAIYILSERVGALGSMMQTGDRRVSTRPSRSWSGGNLVESGSMIPPGAMSPFPSGSMARCLLIPK